VSRGQGAELDTPQRGLDVNPHDLLVTLVGALTHEVKREGERLGFLVFFDDEPTSATYGEHI